MPKTRSSISDAEREVLKVLWEQGPSTVRQIRERLQKQGREWAHTTINTLLSRVQEKGYVTRDARDFAHIFSASLSREEIVQQRLMDLAEQYCDGTSVPLMLALVEGQQFTDREIEEFRQLLDRLENQKTKKKPPNRRRKRKSS